MAQIKGEEIVQSILDKTKYEGVSIDWTEFSKNNKDTIGEKIAAFATSGGGILVIGISKDRVITGIVNEQILITKIGEILRDCQPIPFLGDPEFIEKDGKKVAVYKITGLGGTVCYYKGDPFHRVQDSVKKMGIGEIQEILRRYGLVSWEQRPSPALPEAIDSDELKFYLKNVNERNPTNLKTEMAFLISNRAITDDQKNLTNLGLLALAKNPAEYLPHCKIQLIRFRGSKPTDRIASYLSEKPARKLIDDCFNFTKLNLPIREHYQGTTRTEESIIPEKALREAIVNMVVHRDYSDPQEGLIRIFDDRIEFQNPGAPTQAEYERIRKQGIPIHKNQGLYNFLRPVHQAEAAGQGIPILESEMQRVGLNPPEITLFSNIFHLTLRFGNRTPETLEDIILLYGKEKKTLLAADIMRIHNISRPTAIKILNSLERKGFAKHLGIRRNSKYIFD